MVNNLKKFIDKKFLIKYEKLNDRAEIAEVNSLLEEAFRTAMETKNFEFNHSTGFTDKLNDILDSNGEIFIVRRGKSIIGTISVKLEDIDAWYYTGKAVGPCHLAVSPKYQSMGLGKNLLDLANDYATKLNLPQRITTPEKNTETIGFYERHGFVKVRMYLSGNHYAIYMMNWGSMPPQFTKKQIKMTYECTALSSLMRNFKVCDQQSDEKIQKRWQNEFFKYMEGCSDEQLLDMQRCYRRYGITPKEYSLYGYEEKAAKVRSRYLSRHTVAALYEETKTKQSSELLSCKDVAGVCTEGEYADNTKAYIRVLTVKGEEKAQAAYAYISFNEQGKSERFAGINMDSGAIDTPIYRIASGKKKKSAIELKKSEIENWDSIKAEAERLAKSRNEILLGIDFAHINDKWTAINMTAKPSLVNFQLISRGIRETIEEIAQKEIEVKLPF